MGWISHNIIKEITVEKLASPRIKETEKIHDESKHQKIFLDLSWSSKIVE